MLCCVRPTAAFEARQKGYRTDCQTNVDGVEVTYQAEYLQILSRATRLEDMLDKWEKGELSFVPTCPKSTFYFQLKAMKMYLFALNLRAEVEDVDLQTFNKEFTIGNERK